MNSSPLRHDPFAIYGAALHSPSLTSILRLDYYFHNKAKHPLWRLGIFSRHKVSQKVTQKVTRKSPKTKYRRQRMADQDIALMAHLIRRAGFGATREELEARDAKGYEATVEELLNPDDQGPLDRNEMMRYHPWTWRPGTLPGMGAAEWLHDMINTERPLEEKMALFWHQVFATGVSKVDHYDDVMDMIFKFREKGMGDYRELLLEIAKDPAMIYWLTTATITPTP